MIPIEIPNATAPSLPQISALIVEFREHLQPLMLVALANLGGSPTSPHQSDLEPVIGVLPAFCSRLIEVSCPDVLSASDVPLPIRAELLGRIARLIMERHAQHDVILAASVALMPGATVPAGGLN